MLIKIIFSISIYSQSRRTILDENFISELIGQISHLQGQIKLFDPSIARVKINQRQAGNRTNNFEYHTEIQICIYIGKSHKYKAIIETSDWLQRKFLLNIFIL